MASVIGKYKKYNFEKEITLFKGISDIYEQKIVIPDPPNLNDVFNYSKPTAKQKWERLPSPLHLRELENLQRKKRSGRDVSLKELRYNRMTIEDHKYITDEYRKMYNDGEWVMINGDLTWIPPDYYMFLNRWTVEGNPPLYIDSQRRWYTHWWYLDNKEDCYGMIEMTKRRDGKSSRMGQVAYRKSIDGFRRYVGIQSKDQESVEDFFKKMIVSPWKKLPFWMITTFSNTTNPKDEMGWFQKGESSKNAMDSLGGEEELQGWIKALSSDALKFDGKKLSAYIVEEPGKTKNVDVYERYNIIKPTMREFDKIIGKSIHSTTVEEMEKMGGANFVKMWNDSSRKSDSDDNSTITGMNQHFTPAYDGFKIDDFGRSKILEAKDFLQRERNKLKNKPHELVKYMRKFPFTIREAIQSASGENPFDIYKITQRSTYFMNSVNNTTRKGYFTWVEGQEFKKARWIDDPNGAAVVSYLFENPAMANRMIMQRGKLMPVNDKFTAGADPYRFDKTKSGDPSKAACAIWWDYDPSIDTSDDPSEWKSNRFVFSYLGRPKVKEDVSEQMLMACIYYGAMMYPEVQVSAIWDDFRKYGFEGYLLHDIENGRRSNTPGFNKNEKSLDAGATQVEWYVDKFIQYENHPEIVEAVKEVDIEDTGKHDLFVAVMGALLGAARRRPRLMPNQREHHKEQSRTLEELDNTYSHIVN